MAKNSLFQKMQINPRYLKVTFFAAFVLLLETVLFHALNYIYDYFAATMVISFTVLGIGLGAFTAGKINLDEDELFSISCLGTTVCVYITCAAVLLSYPYLIISSFAIILTFFFSMLYISTLFRNHPANLIYWYDMAGAFFGISLTVLIYKVLATEEIVLFLLVFVPLIGLFSNIKNKRKIKKQAYVFLGLVILGSILFSAQVLHDSFNMFNVLKSFKRKPSLFELRDKSFLNEFNREIIKSYDNLMGRIDVLPAKNDHSIHINGFSTDRFKRNKEKNYSDYYKPKGIKWPTSDVRILYGIVNEPKVFIFGPSVEGAVKSIKKITPLENITAVEINSSMLKIAKKDFVEECGFAYEGLNTIIGNGLSVLKSKNEKYDIITLLNTHSTPGISFSGAPDYLHTFQSYNFFSG